MTNLLKELEMFDVSEILITFFVLSQIKSQKIMNESQFISNNQ